MTYAPKAVAERTGASLDALRYYEREGIVGPIARDGGGRRRYSEEDVRWIGIVRCLRDAGLRITDLRRFAELLREEVNEPPGSDDTGYRAELVAFLCRRRADLEADRDAIGRSLAVLEDKIAYYGEPDREATSAAR